MKYSFKPRLEAPTPGPKRCSTDSAVSNTYDSVTFERPCVPPKTHRIWNGGQAPDRLPMSFRRYAWPFKSYRGVKIQLFTFTLHLLGPGVQLNGRRTLELWLKLGSRPSGEGESACNLRSRTDAPINARTFSAVKKCSQVNISIIIGVETKNSSDLSLGRRPMSKSNEFFVSTPKVLEILRCENIRFSVHTYNLSEHDSARGNALSLLT